MTAVADPDLAALIAGYAPFDSLGPDSLHRVAEAAQVNRYRSGEVVLDAFVEATTEVFLVIAGQVDLWNDHDRVDEEPDEQLGPGGVFGFSAMLTERSVGPRAVAATGSTIARMPGELVAPAFTSRRGVRFLAESVLTAGRRGASSGGPPTYSSVDELITTAPVEIAADATVAEAARLMTERTSSYVAVRRSDGGFGLVTDELLRRRVLTAGLPVGTPVEAIMEPSGPTATLGDSAAEALILMLDHDAEVLLVTDRSGALRGAVAHRDFAVSSTTGGVSLHEQLRRAATIDELERRAKRVPEVLGDLLTRGLASGRVIAVYSAILDTIVRRAIGLTFASRPDLSVDAFTWLALGSNGRREAILSSDVDSAVAFSDHVSDAEILGYREVFVDVCAVLARAGLSSDDHGATAQHSLFARTNAQWRAAAREWLAKPAENNGAVMTSLLVDGRPIHGDPGLPAVTRVFGDLRRHRGTMRLLLEESLARRARLGSFRGLLGRRAGRFDIKNDAVLPIVNLARWAALSVGSAALPTTERLQAAAGSAMLPEDQATTLVEVFEVLQRLRLRYQILQLQAGTHPTDVVEMDQMSPIDRSIVAQAVREIAAVQKRMDNIAHYVPVESWSSPASR